MYGDNHYQIQADYNWIEKVINSCVTEEQKKACFKLIQNFRQKHNEKSLYLKLLIKTYKLDVSYRSEVACVYDIAQIVNNKNK